MPVLVMDFVKSHLFNAINMKLNQEKIEKAITVLEGRQAQYPNGFPKEIKGDISSFGASIIQAGILPTVLFFSEGEFKEAAARHKNNSDENTKARRALLMKVVFDVLELPDTATINKKRPLLDYVRKNLGNADALNRITEAALAVKIALRAFHFDTSTDKKESNPSPENNNPTT